MNTAFTDDQFDQAYADGIEHHWWSLTRNSFVEAKVRQLVGGDARMLEVGCGRGIVVAHLRNAGIDCHGVELAEVAPLPAVAAHVLGGTDAVDLPATERAAYDALLLLDVIEHLDAPDDLLRRIAGAFPNLSHVFVTVPARSELWSNYDSFYGHRRRYSLAMLDALSVTLDWQLVGRGYFFHSVYVPAWLMSKLKIDRPVTIVAPRGAMRRLHRLVASAMLLDCRCLPGSLPGTSAYACFDVKRSQDSGRLP